MYFCISQIRGLCTESIFNSEYILSLTEEEGKVRYLGQYTSSIVFNVTSQAWHWRDMKREGGLAVRSVETRHEKHAIYTKEFTFFSIHTYYI